MSDAVSEIIVKGTLALLVAFSIATWALVLVKFLQNVRVKNQDKRFKGALTEQGPLPKVEALRKYSGPKARVAIAGITAWENSQTAARDLSEIEIPRDLFERGLKRQIQKERALTEAGLSVLASIGTTSPFVGLFGTVWGIMHALKRISGAGSASLDVVAGPIGEALVATGIGIAVAVPAVLAYNFFVRKLKLQSADLEDFANHLVSLALSETWHREPARSAERAVTRLPEARNSASLREARV